MSRKKRAEILERLEAIDFDAEAGLCSKACRRGGRLQQGHLGCLLAIPDALGVYVPDRPSASRVLELFQLRSRDEPFVRNALNLERDRLKALVSEKTRAVRRYQRRDRSPPREVVFSVVDTGLQSVAVPSFERRPGSPECARLLSLRL